MAFISGSNEFLVSSFLVVGSSFVVQGSPLWSVHGSLLQLFRLAVSVSLYRLFGRPRFLLPIWSSPYIRRLGIRNSSMRITCPTHRSWALMSMDSMPVEFARSRTSRLVMRSCHLIPSMERRARMWKDSSFLTCLRHNIHASQP